MTLDFSEARWERVRDNWRRWREGTLGRPLISATMRDRDPGRPRPKAPLLTQATCADFDVPAEALIDRIDYELSRQRFLGDAFPCCSLDCFGPGVLAAMLGARVDNASGNVWFLPAEDLPIEALRFEFDPENRWFRRLCDLYEAGRRRWGADVLMGMTDLGGNLDVLASFLPGEKILTDLALNAGEVKRLTWEVHEAWHACFSALNETIGVDAPGFSDWSGLYYEEPGYILQCDLSYMIGPPMFAEFVAPELAASTRRLAHAFYHLDGVGQLAHLDAVLDIDGIEGVQWVPGDGKPDCSQWPEVYRRIRTAGKRMQLLDGFRALEAVRSQIGSVEGIHLVGVDPRDPNLTRRLAEYGAA